MKRAVSVWVCIVSAGCGAAFSSTLVRNTPDPEEVVYACAVEQIKELRFETLSRDDNELRLVANRDNPTLRRSDPTFRKGLDRLTVEVDPTEGDAAAVQVTAQSLLEYFNRRGQTFEEIKASPEAREAADTILDRCAPSADAVEPGA